MRRFVLVLALALTVATPAATAQQEPVTELQWSPDGSRLLFRRGHDVMLFDRRTTSVRRVSASSASWLPRRLGMIVYRGALPYLATADGRIIRRLPRGGVASPDGTRIAFASTNGSTLSILHLAGLRLEWRINARDLPPDCETCSTDIDYAVWAPDGRRLLVSVLVLPPVGTVKNPRSSLFLVDLRTRSVTHFAENYCSGEPLEWAPTSDAVAYKVTNCDGEEQGLLRIRRLDGDVTELGPAVALDWAPRGRSLAFRRVRYGTRELVVRDAVGRERVYLRVGAFGWAPDGKRLVVERQDGLFVVTGRRLRRLANGREPTWSPVRDEIGYVAPGCGKTSSLYLIRADGTGRRRIGPGCG